MMERRKFQAEVQRSWGRNVLGVFEDGKRSLHRKSMTLTLLFLLLFCGMLRT